MEAAPNECAICLEPLGDGDKIGTPDSCNDHEYCIPCLLKWSRKECVCPTDRQHFAFILVRKRGSQEILRQIPVAPDVPNAPQVDQVVDAPNAPQVNQVVDAPNAPQVDQVVDAPNAPQVDQVVDAPNAPQVDQVVDAPNAPQVDQVVDAPNAPQVDQLVDAPNAPQVDQVVDAGGHENISYCSVPEGPMDNEHPLSLLRNNIVQGEANNLPAPFGRQENEQGSRFQSSNRPARQGYQPSATFTSASQCPSTNDIGPGSPYQPSTSYASGSNQNSREGGFRPGSPYQPSTSYTSESDQNPREGGLGLGSPYQPSTSYASRRPAPPLQPSSTNRGPLPQNNQPIYNPRQRQVTVSTAVKRKFEGEPNFWPQRNGSPNKLFQGANLSNERTGRIHHHGGFFTCQTSKFGGQGPPCISNDTNEDYSSGPEHQGQVDNASDTIEVFSSDSEDQETVHNDNNTIEVFSSDSEDQETVLNDNNTIEVFSSDSEDQETVRNYNDNETIVVSSDEEDEETVHNANDKNKDKSSDPEDEGSLDDASDASEDNASDSDN